jgi:hypothetical protein
MGRILLSLLPLAAITCAVPDEPVRPGVEHEVSFAIDQSLADEAIGTTDVYVRLDSPSDELVTVEVAVSGGSATAREDFSLATSVATFEPGATMAKVSLAITYDLREEDEEDLELTLRSPRGAVLGERISHHVRISANWFPRVRFTARSSWAAEGGGAQRFEVRLDRASPVDVVLAYVATGTTEAADHGVVDGQLTIPAGALAGVLPVQINDDSLDEDDEQLELVLSAQRGAVVQPGEGQHVHTILDDDLPPAVGFASGASAVSEGATAMLELKLTSASEREIAVDFAAASGSADASDCSLITGGLVAGTLVFPPGVTVLELPILANSDDLAEDNETVVVKLSNPVHATLGAEDAHELTIADAKAPPTLSF